MKKGFLMLMTAVLLFSFAMAESALTGLIPASARLVEKDTEDGLTEYEYRDGDTRYDLWTRGDTPVKLEIEGPVWTGESTAITTEAAAVAEALKHVPGAETEGAFSMKEDRRQVWGVFLRLNGDVYELELDAETSRLMEITRFFGAEVLPATEAWKLLCAAKGQAQLTSITLEYDDGYLLYTGEATLNGERYEFEQLASSGKVLEWERD